MKKENKNRQSNVMIAIDKVTNKSNILKQWKKEYDMEKKIIEKIIEARKKKGITEKKLAELIGVKQSEILKIEKRLYSPSLEMIISIATELELKLFIE